MLAEWDFRQTSDWVRNACVCEADGCAWDVPSFAKNYVLTTTLCRPLGVSWQQRTVSLTEQCVWIGKRTGDQHALLDFIPLIEIVHVSASQDQSRIGAGNHHTRSMRDFFAKDETKSERHERDEDEDSALIFAIHPLHGGVNSGKPCIMKAGTAEEAQKWASEISRLVTAAKQEQEDNENKEMGPLHVARKSARRLYNSVAVQIATGTIILASYMAALAGSQILPEPDSAQYRQLGALEWFFTVMFTTELLLNMFAHWFWEFFDDGWNVFDFVVVVVSLIGLGVEGLPALNVLRLIRVFKMMRLFTRARKLRMLINALASSVLPVINSFCILMLITSIYAVVATDLFRDKSEFFSDFTHSIYSLFQIGTGDAWNSGIVRPLLDQFDVGSPLRGWTVLFFVSFSLIVGVVLMNIVVAVLLDEFISAVASDKAAAHAEELDEKEKEQLVNATADGPLDPLIKSLQSFTTRDDLHRRIFNLYQRIDLDASGGITMEELNAGLLKLSGPNGCPMQLSQEEWVTVTNQRELLNEDGELTASAFETMMLQQLKGFSHRKIQSALSRCTTDSNENFIFGLKIIMTSVDYVEAMHGLLTRQYRSTLPSRLSSRKTLINKMFRRPLAKSMAIWKEHLHAREDGHLACGPGGPSDEGLIKGKSWNDMFDAAEHHEIQLGEQPHLDAASQAASTAVLKHRLSQIESTLRRMEGLSCVSGLPCQKDAMQFSADEVRGDANLRIAALEEGMRKITADQEAINSKAELILHGIQAMGCRWGLDVPATAGLTEQVPSGHQQRGAESSPLHSVYSTGDQSTFEAALHLMAQKDRDRKDHTVRQGRMIYVCPQSTSRGHQDTSEPTTTLVRQSRDDNEPQGLEERVMSMVELYS